MAVFPDRIVLKNSTDNQATIEAAIGSGGSSEIVQGEIVLGLESGTANIYTLDGSGNIVRFNPSSSQGRAIVSNTEPTTGLGGLALVDGDMWFNGSDDSYYVYESGAWVQVVTSTSVPNLDDIGDVSVPGLTGANDGYILTYDSSLQLWVAGEPAALGTVTLNGIEDCSYVNGEFFPLYMEAIQYSNASGGLMTFRIPDPYTGNITYTFPSADGTASQALLTDGSGGLSWGTPAGGSLNELTDVSYLTGEFFPTEMTAIKFSDSDGDTMRFSLPAGYTGNFSFSLPPSDGDADEVLSTDGSGVLSWASPMGRAAVSATAPTTNLNGGTLADGDLWLKSDDSVYYVYSSSTWTAIAGGSGGGGGTRTSQSVATGSIANEASADVTLTGVGKAGQLIAIETDQAAWVTVYASQAVRTADASRPQTQDPEGGSGVLLEVITTGAQTIMVTPSVSYFNYESVTTDELYLKVVNKSGSTQAITTTITVIPSET
ncbi:hypothetical protein SCRES1_gp86 [Synechococcus phage S-CRES1]|nr:hypothetical protein SCRES1_gp86 [Synechococcus phage S-CRES1]